MSTLARTLTALLLAALVAAPLAASTAAAEAESGATEDTVDRVPAPLDIRWFAAHNRERRLQAEIGLGRFEARRTSAYVIVEGTGRARGENHVVGWTSLRGERPGRVLARLTRDGVERLRCRGLQVRATRTQLSLTVPQRCLGEAAGRVWVSALTESRSGSDADRISRFPLRRG